jgi:two-component system LytT family sensor kinase
VGIHSATDRAREVRGFYIHAAAFLIVNLMLVVINLAKSPKHLWFQWVLLDWGVGLATHAWLVFRGSKASYAGGAR